jgi:uncharacterized protein with HEPN domain
MTFDAFRRDERTYDAVVRNLEIIGEAAKHVPNDLRCQVPGVDWRKVAAFRDVLAHAYHGIDDDVRRGAGESAVAGNAARRVPRPVPVLTPLPS